MMFAITTNAAASRTKAMITGRSPLSIASDLASRAR